MLDKSIPYYNLIMRRKTEAPLPEPILPEGYSFILYSKGDESSWAEIVTSVGEFDDMEEAKNYFASEYLPYPNEIKRRVLFVQTMKGHKVATFTIWWNYKGELRIPSVHYFAVKPQYQGLGLGKAVLFKGIERALIIEGERDIYLHTQSWSYKAIGIYLKAGFRFLEKEAFEDYSNDYFQAMPLLKEKMKERLL